MSKIKICGLFRDCDISFVNEAGPDYAGFILYYPKSRRSIDAERAAQLRRRLRPGIRAVGVFVDQEQDLVCSAASLIGLDVIQLHGREDNTYIESVRAASGLPVWKAFKIRDSRDLAEAAQSAADEILLDSGKGTGKLFDWSLLEGFPRPFILAGGLTPERIPEAMRLCGAALLDLSSGVETDGCKDREKIKAAVRAAHAQDLDPARSAPGGRTK